MKQIKDVCNKIKDLVKATEGCSDENGYGALVCLINNLKKGRQVLRSAEHSRNRRWCRKQLQHSFFKHLFKTAKDMIAPKVKSEPKVSKSMLNEFFQKVALNPNRTVPLRDLDGLDDFSMNIGMFNFKISSKFSKSSKLGSYPK